MLPQGQMRVIGLSLPTIQSSFGTPNHRHRQVGERYPQAHTERPFSVMNRRGVSNRPMISSAARDLAEAYLSLVPMAQEHRKPIFSLTPADRAVGASSAAGTVQGAKSDFKIWRIRIAGKGISPSLLLAEKNIPILVLSRLWAGYLRRARAAATASFAGGFDVFLTPRGKRVFVGEFGARVPQETCEGFVEQSSCGADLFCQFLTLFFGASELVERLDVVLV